MTVVNLAVGLDRALVVTDEAISGGAVPLRMSKAMSFPHLRMVAAVAGHHLMALELAVWLNSGDPVGRDVLDVVADAPAVLRAGWSQCDMHAATNVFLVGITRDDTVAAFALDSGRDFEPHAIPPGAWLNPGFAPEPAPMPSPAEPPQTALQPSTTPAPAVRWADLAQAAVDAVRRQHREQRVPVGGRVQSVLLTPDSIVSTWLYDLGDPPG